MWKQRLGWSVWLAAAALLYLFENSAATLTLLAASLLIPLASIGLAAAASRHVAAQLSLPEEGEKGGRTTGVLHLKNSGIFALAWASGQIVCHDPLTGEATSAPLSALLLPMGGARLTFSLAPSHCGQIDVALRDFYTGDLFGLWRGRHPVCATGRLLVRPPLYAPRVSLVESTTVVTDGGRYSTTRPGSDPSETFSMREYVPGDPIKQIHWKLSQKTDTLMLRELGLPVVDETLLLFAPSYLVGDAAPSPAQIDGAAAVFLSLSRALLTGGSAHTVGWQAGEHGLLELHEIRTEQAFQDMAQRLLSLPLTQREETVAGAFRTWCEDNVYAHVAVVCAAFLPDADCLLHGNRVTVLLSGDSRGQRPAPGIHLIPFSPGQQENQLSTIDL